MDRDMRRGLLVAIASGVAAVALVTASRADGAHTPDVPAVARESQARGWPHTPTVREANGVARFTNTQVGAMAARSETWCLSTRHYTAATWVCVSRLVFTHNELTGARLPRPRVYRFQTVTRVWEDGSARVFYPGV